MEPRYLFEIDRIAQSLKQYQKAFAEINPQLSLHREEFTDSILENILAAYEYLNGLLEQKIEIFTPGGLHCMLELNHIVLCGTDPATRYQYHHHILKTRKRYQELIRPIRKWVLARARRGSPFKTATGFYTRSLSQPQLFIEGNHRTENIILNYLLLCEGMPPYIISDRNAIEYLELSSGIKFSNRRSVQHKLVEIIYRERRFRTFLMDQVDAQFLKEKVN
jgi:hypothetical protein